MSRQEVVKLMKDLGMHNWTPSIFAWAGRSFPRGPVFFVTFWSVLVVIIAELWWDDINGDGAGDFQVPSTVLTLTGSGLFFLLVFRTNSSYSRWWEGRIKWGGTINRTRDLVRQAVLYIEHDTLVERVTKYTIAFPYCMKHHLRFEHTLEDLRTVAPSVRLSDTEVEQILASDHMPLYVLDVLGQCLNLARKEGNLGDYHACLLDENIRELEDMLGVSGCIEII
jgi:putative membrane protein